MENRKDANLIKCPPKILNKINSNEYLVIKRRQIPTTKLRISKNATQCFIDEIKIASNEVKKMAGKLAKLTNLCNDSTHIIRMIYQEQKKWNRIY